MANQTVDVEPFPAQLLTRLLERSLRRGPAAAEWSRRNQRTDISYEAGRRFPFCLEEQVLEPDHRRGRQRGHAPDRQQHTGHERFTRERIVTDAERLRHVAE